MAVPNAMISVVKVAFATRKRHLSEKKYDTWVDGYSEVFYII